MEGERQRNYRLDTFGMGAGFLLVLAFLAAAVILGLNDHGTAATILGSVDVVAITGIFVLRKFKS